LFARSSSSARVGDLLSRDVANFVVIVAEQRRPLRP
jgi:hypothetical protein